MRNLYNFSIYIYFITQQLKTGNDMSYFIHDISQKHDYSYSDRDCRWRAGLRPSRFMRERNVLG